MTANFFRHSYLHRLFHAVSCVQCECTFVIYYFIYLCWTFIPDIKFEFRMWMSSNAWLKSSLHTWNNFNLDDDDARKHSSVSPFPPGCSHPWPGLQSPDLLLLPQLGKFRLPPNVCLMSTVWGLSSVLCRCCAVHSILPKMHNDNKILCNMKTVHTLYALRNNSHRKWLVYKFIRYHSTLHCSTFMTSMFSSFFKAYSFKIVLYSKLIRWEKFKHGIHVRNVRWT